jgi:hypothetical protein
MSKGDLVLKILSILAFVIFAVNAFATEWDYEPVTQKVPTCVAYFAVSLPGDPYPHDPANSYVTELLHKKGYIANYEAPCDPGPGICYGASAYLEIRGYAGKYRDGSYAVRFAAYHVHSRRSDNESMDIGIYNQQEAPMAWDAQTNLNTLTKMVENLPSCRAATLKKHRLHCDTKDCYGDLIDAAPGTFVDDKVGEFKCVEAKTGLAVNGTITESTKERWRFFVAVELNNGKHATIETRSYQGMDVGDKSSFYGYSSGSVLDYRDTYFPGGKVTRTLDLKKEVLTGDKKNHSFDCGK